MATSLDQIVYDALSVIKGSTMYSDDNQITIEQVEYSALNNRALLIRQDQNKGRSLSDNITQVLPCVDVVYIDSSECPCDVPTECTILRTKIKIPRPIEVAQKDLITRVARADIKGKGWSIISYARASVAGINSETANTPKAFFHNGYIYVLNAPPGIKKISISEVAEDPREVANFKSCDGNPCYNNSMDFPISNYMLPTLKDMILKDLKIQVTAPIDYKGDERTRGEGQTRE